MTTQTPNLAHAVGTPDARRFAEMVPRNGHSPIFFGYMPVDIGRHYALMDEVTGAKLEVNGYEVRVLWTEELDRSKLRSEGVGIRPPESSSFVVIKHREAKTGYRLLYLNEQNVYE
ncbi:hypothetical protein HY487_00360 [Candidatus Woesearchaeota archaeon]|nr:hypothetical protein [Candidatus Woesearchaeota archaeon]